MSIFDISEIIVNTMQFTDPSTLGSIYSLHKTIGSMRHSNGYATYRTVCIDSVEKLHSFIHRWTNEGFRCGTILFDDSIISGKKSHKVLRQFVENTLSTMEGIHTIEFPNSWTTKITLISGMFPSTIRKITIGEEYYAPLDQLSTLPLTHIKSLSYFRQSLKHLPKTLTHLYISFDSDRETIRDLPPQLQSLHTSSEFYEPMSDLPRTLVELDLGFCYKHPVEHLPTTLKKIKFLFYGIQPIKMLPIGLKEIYLGDGFNQSIDHFPDTLEYIRLGREFNQPIGKYPSQLRKLSIGLKYVGGLYKQPFTVPFPERLVNLKIYSNYEMSEFEHKIPSGLKKLGIGFKWNHSLEEILSNALLLRVLILKGTFNQPITWLPGSIEYMQLPATYEYMDKLPRKEGMKVRRMDDRFY
jgi:FNIP Repeat